MSNEVGELQVKALLTILIGETVNFFSVGKTMSDVQVATTVEMILEDYSVYKPDYFILCFKRAKKGQYGTTYDRIDGNVIFNWLAKFDAEYTAEIEAERRNEHKRIVNNTISYGEFSTIPEDPRDRPVPMPKNIREMINTVAKKEPQKSQLVFSDEQKLVRSFRTDFERIIEDNGQDDKEFVHFHGTPGKSMNFQEYFEYRFLIIDKPNFFKNRF